MVMGCAGCSRGMRFACAAIPAAATRLITGLSRPIGRSPRRLIQGPVPLPLPGRCVPVTWPEAHASALPAGIRSSVPLPVPLPTAVLVIRTLLPGLVPGGRHGAAGRLAALHAGAMIIPACMQCMQSSIAPLLSICSSMHGVVCNGPPGLRDALKRMEAGIEKNADGLRTRTHSTAQPCHRSAKNLASAANLPSSLCTAQLHPCLLAHGMQPHDPMPSMLVRTYLGLSRLSRGSSRSLSRGS